MDIKLLHKSNTFSNFGSHKLGSWFSTFSIARRKNGSTLKNSKSLSEFPRLLCIFFFFFSRLIY